MSFMFDPFRELDRIGGFVPTARTSRMPMDLYRAGDEFVVQVDLPGADPQSIDLDIDQNVLTIQASRATAKPEDGKWLAHERPTGEYRRQLTLSKGLDLDGITAGYEHGVLTLRVPVAEAAKPRKIEVQTAQSGPQQVQSADEVAAA